MNEQFTNTPDQENEVLAQKLSQIAEQTRANGQFASELEERLRDAHKPRAGWSTTLFRIPPTLRWVALMVLLALVLSLSIKTLIPPPQPAENSTPVNPGKVTTTPAPDGTTITSTPAPEGEGIEFRGAKLYMNASLPDTPAEANIYTLTDPQPATADYARTLADQLGIVGEIYSMPEQNTGANAYMITDGKQQLIVNAENNFSYTSDMVLSSRNYNGFKNDNAENSIRDFLTQHGFTFNFKMDVNSIFGNYVLVQLAPDGLPMQYEYFSQPVMRVTFNEDGSVLSIYTSLMKIDPASLGSFGIISAEEALQKLLDDTLPAGKIESVHGSPDPDVVLPKEWYRDFPDNETVTTYGNVMAYDAVEASMPAVILLGNVPLIGNTTGMESLNDYAFIQVTGQFIVENGIRTFNVESWDGSIEQAYITGTARREGDNIIVTNEDGSGGEYILVAPPADLPLDFTFPDSQLSSSGVVIDGRFDWTTVQFIADVSSMGGGGGGGGMGFYALNLSGTPIPFPTPVHTENRYSVQELAGFLKYTVKAGETLESIAAANNITVDDIVQANGLMNADIGEGWVITLPGIPGRTQLDGDRGTTQIQIFEKPNGTRRYQYNFLSETDGQYYQLTGDNLEPLQDQVNRPIKIWGSISYDENGAPFLDVEKFESIYPDLKFEILIGSQESMVLDGIDIVLFTTDGTTYIQMVSVGGYPDSNVIGDGEEVQIEALRVPDETYNGYPTVRVFSLGPATSPVDGKPFELTPMADVIQVFPDPFGDGDQYIQPDIIIDRVELIYFVSNPMYQQEDNPATQVRYLQPAWHFQGQYSNGDALDIMIQALKQEYLSPNLLPNLTPG